MSEGEQLEDYIMEHNNNNNNNIATAKYSGEDGDDEAILFHALKVKPALKKIPTHHLKSDNSAADSAAAATTAASASVSAASADHNKKKGLKWDEKAIEEHDLLRGTRMKIDEPNTPYTHYDSGQESDDSRRPKSPVEPKQHQALSWDSLQNRLDTVAAVRAAYPSSPSSSYHSEHDHSDNEVDDRKREMQQIEFKEHRKRHYNEMELVRKFRQEHPDAIIGNDDDDFADDEGLDDL